jgi:hypothetical protein
MIGDEGKDTIASLDAPCARRHDEMGPAVARGEEPEQPNRRLPGQDGRLEIDRPVTIDRPDSHGRVQE